MCSNYQSTPAVVCTVEEGEKIKRRLDEWLGGELIAQIYPEQYFTKNERFSYSLVSCSFLSNATSTL